MFENINSETLNNEQVLTKFMKYRPELFCEPHGLKVTLPIDFNDVFDSQLYLNSTPSEKLLGELEYYIQRLQAVHILSLTTKCARDLDSNNMWGLYSDSGKGIAFEFDYIDFTNRLSIEPLINFLRQYNNANDKCRMIKEGLTEEIYNYIIAILKASREYYYSCKRSSIILKNHPEVETMAKDLMSNDINYNLLSGEQIKFLNRLLVANCFQSLLNHSTYLRSVNYVKNADTLSPIFKEYLVLGEKNSSQLDQISKFMSTKHYIWEHECEERVILPYYTSSILSNIDSTAKDNYNKARNKLRSEIRKDLCFIYFSEKVKYEAIDIVYRDTFVTRGIIPKVFLPYPRKIYLGWNFDYESSEGRYAYNKIRQFCKSNKIELVKLDKMVNYKNNTFEIKK